MRLIIVGCGRIGAELAQASSADGHQVAVIDRDAYAFDRLGTGFHGHTVQGSVLDQEVLQRAGIEGADGLAAVTSDDATNFVTARLAKQIYQVPNIVARVFDPAQLQTFEGQGIQAVASSSWGAKRIEQLLLHPGIRVFDAVGHGEVSLVELLVPPHLAGRTIEKLQAIGTISIVALVRGGEAFIPDPEAIIENSDLVFMSINTADLKSLEKFIAGEGRRQ